MTPRSTSDTTAPPNGAEAPWLMLSAQWQQQVWQAWSRVLAEALPDTTAVESPATFWTRQAEALTAVARQAAQEQQALLASWQQMQIELLGRWSEQSEQLMHRPAARAASPRIPDVTRRTP
jgi:hypothetical protein